MRPPEGSASKLFFASRVLVSTDQSWNTLAKKCASGPVGPGFGEHVDPGGADARADPCTLDIGAGLVGHRGEVHQGVTSRPRWARAISMP